MFFPLSVSALQPVPASADPSPLLPPGRYSLLGDRVRHGEPLGVRQRGHGKLLGRPAGGRETVLVSTCVDVFSVPCPPQRVCPCVPMCNCLLCTLSSLLTIETVLSSTCADVFSVPCPHRQDCPVVHMCGCLLCPLFSSSRLS